MDLSAWVSAGATVVLVLITAFYAKRTSDMVKEMERTRLISTMPVLDFRTDHHFLDSEKGHPRTVEIVNVGTSPALRISVTITKDGRLFYSRYTSLMPDTVEIGLLSVNGSSSLNLPGQHFRAEDLQKFGDDGPTIRLDITYHNLFGRQFQSRAILWVEAQDLLEKWDDDQLLTVGVEYRWRLKTDVPYVLPGGQDG